QDAPDRPHGIADDVRREQAEAAQEADEVGRPPGQSRPGGAEVVVVLVLGAEGLALLALLVPRLLGLLGRAGVRRGRLPAVGHSASSAAGAAPPSSVPSSWPVSSSSS